MKSEIRNPKAERRPKSEIRNQYWIFQPAAAREYTPLRWVLAGSFWTTGSDFGFQVSFGLRPSGFGFPTVADLS
jgi:hypothetical protein